MEEVVALLLTWGDVETFKSLFTLTHLFLMLLHIPVSQMICQHVPVIPKETANHLANKYTREYNRPFHELSFMNGNTVIYFFALLLLSITLFLACLKAWVRRLLAGHTKVQLPHS